MDQESSDIYIPPHRRSSASPEKKYNVSRRSSREKGSKDIINRSPRYDQKNQRSPRKENDIIVTFNTLIDPSSPPKKLFFVIDIPPAIEPIIVDPPEDIEPHRSEL